MDGTTCLDISEDINLADFNLLSQKYELPEFVKKASSDDLFPADPLPSTVYADEVDRHYDCHNPAATWMSLLYFQEKKAAFAPATALRIEQRLNEFATYWGVAAPQRLEVKEAAEADEDYAFVWAGENGTKQRAWRLKSAAEVKNAAEALLKYRDQISFKDRHVIAGRIMEKAAAHGAGLGDTLEAFVERQAGQGVCDPAEVAEMIRQRVKLAKDDGQRAQILNLAEAVEKQPRFALDPSSLVKLAEAVDDIDRGLKITGGYGNVLRRPEDVIFSATYRTVQASVDDAVPLTTGTVYSKADFSKVALNDLGDLFGKDFMSEVADGIDVDTEKLAAQAAALPRPDAETFEKLLKESGVPPLTHKAAADRYGITAEAMEALAEAY